MFFKGRLIKNGMWVVFEKKRGILHAPFIEVRDPNSGAVIDRDYSRVDFHVVGDDRLTIARLTPAAEEFFANARLARLLEIPERSRPSKAAGARLGYV